MARQSLRTVGAGSTYPTSRQSDSAAIGDNHRPQHARSLPFAFFLFY